MLIELGKVLKQSDFQSSRSLDILNKLADCLDKYASDSMDVRVRIKELTERSDSKPRTVLRNSQN